MIAKILFLARRLKIEEFKSKPQSEQMEIAEIILEELSKSKEIDVC